MNLKWIRFQSRKVGNPSISVSADSFQEKVADFLGRKSLLYTWDNQVIMRISFALSPHLISFLRKKLHRKLYIFSS